MLFSVDLITVVLLVLAGSSWATTGAERAKTEAQANTWNNFILFPLFKQGTCHKDANESNL